jgi:hypothetical protein
MNDPMFFAGGLEFHYFGFELVFVADGAIAHLAAIVVDCR